MYFSNPVDEIKYCP